MRVLLSTSKWHHTALQRLHARGAETLVVDGGDSREVAEAFASFNPQAVLSRVLPIDEVALSSAPALRIIAKNGVGVDNINLEAATAHGVVVMFSLGANSRSVAEHALGLMFALARNITLHDRNIRIGHWTRFQWPAHELAGKRLGLVGFGGSGRMLAEMAASIGMDVSAYSPSYRYGPPPAHVHAMDSLNALLAEVDIVSLHCPLTKETRGMMGVREFELMRVGSWLINTSRGAVVDEAALLTALRTERLGGAALDCYVEEPLPAAHGLLGLENVVLTPHVAGSTVQSAVRTSNTAVDNILAFLDGGQWDARMVANPAVLASLKAT